MPMLWVDSETWDWLVKAVARIDRRTAAMFQVEQQETAKVDDLVAQVAAIKGVVDSAVAALDGLKTKLDAAIASNDPAKLAQLSADLGAAKDALAGAIARDNA